MLQLLLVCLIINLPSAYCQFFVQAAIGGATATGQGANPEANLQKVTPPSAMADANIAAFLAGDRTNLAFNKINSNTPTAQGTTSSDGFTAFTNGGSDMGNRPGYGNLNGYDYGRDIPNAGYGGYVPNRGGFSGYWEPGVHPVPLAMQGWGLFMPRPPVEITTPTTTATTRPTTTAAPTTTTARPNTTIVTTLPTTATLTTTTTTPLRTTTLAATTTVLPYAINNPSYSFKRMKISPDPAPKLATLPEILILNGQKVRVTPIDSDEDFQAIFGNNKAAFGNLQLSDSLQNPLPVPELTVSNPDMFELPSTCVPVTMPSTSGQCVPNALLQIACSNMIVAPSDNCKRDSWCCFLENR